MSYLTRYGSFWGMIPETTGRVFWVAPAASYTVEGQSYSASDNNDGLSPERAFLTLDYAIGKCTANVGDVIVLLPGAHSWAAVQTVDVAGLVITGIPRQAATPLMRGAGTRRHVTTVTSSAANSVIAVTADNTEIAFLHVIPVTAQAGIDVQGTNINLHDLTFDMATPADSTSTFGISITGATSLLRVANCTVNNDGAQGPWFDDSAGSATITLTESVIENCLVSHSGSTAWAEAMSLVSGAEGVIIRDIDFMHTSGGLITLCIQLTGNTTDYGVMIARCTVPVGGALETVTATSDVQLLNNYIATIDGGTGGTLMTT